MLYTIDGINGNGKTLHALDWVEKFRSNQKDEQGNDLPDREVYYFGINELKLNWLPFDDPQKWYELPHKAIIVIDEAQKHFRLRQPKDKLPLYASEVEDHRHKGWDIVLITPDARFIDHHIRRHIYSHKHIERKFGTESAVILEWQGFGDYEDYHSRALATKTPYLFPKKYYGAYKSAEIHTAKRKIPKMVFVIPLIIAFIIGCIYLLISTLMGIGEPDTPVDTDSVGLIDSAMNQFKPQQKQFLTFANNLQPEIESIPQSAPFYRELYKAKSYPKPQCITSAKRDRCFCNSQQGSRMNVSHRMCLNYVDNGYFDPTIEDKEGRASYASREVKRQRSSTALPDKQYYPSGLNNKISFN
jgi:zona occludens toxin